MPLKLSLKPNEVVIVNGAVLRNGDRRGSILLQNQARILRHKDVMHPEDAIHYSQKLYFSVMQMYLTGKIDGILYEYTTGALATALAESEQEEDKQLILDISRSCAAGEMYKALSQCRRLMKQYGDQNRG